MTIILPLEPAQYARAYDTLDGGTVMMESKPSSPGQVVVTYTPAPPTSTTFMLKPVEWWVPTVAQLEQIVKLVTQAGDEAGDSTGRLLMSVDSILNVRFETDLAKDPELRILPHLGMWVLEQE